MADLITDETFDEKKYGSLKTLTLLTFIGSGLALLYILVTPWLLSFYARLLNQATTSGRELTASEAQKIADGHRAIDLAQANMVPLMIIGIIATVGCIIGAMWMRKLKKEGYYIYLAGEILPIIAGFVLMGTGQFNGVLSVIIALCIPVLFIILYSVNFKYLK